MKTQPIDGLVKAVRRNAWPEALELALSLWRPSRDAALHRLILGIGQQIDQTVKPLAGPKADIVRKQLAWAKKKDPTTLGRLLEPNPVGNWADRYRLMDALIDWPADPRIGAHALGLAKSFPRNHLTVPSYFPPLLDVLVQHADFVVAEAAQDKRSNIKRGEAKAMANALKECVALPAAERAKIEALLPSVEAPAASGDEATLLEAVYARPEDDAARAVYADALAARGDPRGEFITLQLVARPTAAQREQMRALLAKHEKTWSGPLALVLEKRVYERGFLVAGELGYSIGKMDFHPSAPEWNTVERLVRATAKIGAQFARLVELETSEKMTGSFARLVSLKIDDLAQVAKAELPKLESLDVHSATAEQLNAFLRRAKTLTSLTVHSEDAELFSELSLPEGLKRLSASKLATLVRDASGWKLELRAPPTGNYGELGAAVAQFENQPLSAITFAGSWNRFGPRNLADMVGPKLKALITTAIANSRGKFMQ